jgi:hypothetical protein
VDIDSGSVQNHLDGVTPEKRRQDAERLLEVCVPAKEPRRRSMSDVWDGDAIAMMWT